MKKKSSPVKKPSKSDVVQTLHDGLCQTLTGIHLFANVLAKRVKEKAPKLADDMAELQGLIEQSRNECHDLVVKLKEEKVKSERKTRRQAAPSR